MIDIHLTWLQALALIAAGGLLSGFGDALFDYCFSWWRERKSRR